MKLSSTTLICCSLATILCVDVDASADLHEYEPQDLNYVALQTNDFNKLDSNRRLNEESGYTYQFRMDLSTPLEKNSDGTPTIDSCIRWDNRVSSTNFTWYGISFQLPEDAVIEDLYWFGAPAKSVKEDGYVQLFNRTHQGVAGNNFTTSTNRPVIRTRINDDIFWTTFAFDFSDGSSNYLEQKSKKSVLCVVEEADDGSFSRTVVDPTMTVSLELLSGPAPVPTPSPDPSSKAGTFFAMLTVFTSISLYL